MSKRYRMLVTDKDAVGNDATESLQAYGLAANHEHNSWFVLSEIAINIRRNKNGRLTGITITVPAATMGVGYTAASGPPLPTRRANRSSEATRRCGRTKTIATPR